MLRQSVSLYFHDSTFYADEFKDYFTTLHGLIYDHMLGEWYESKDMRSYVMLFPLLPFVMLYKWLQIENIYILEIIIKAVIGIYTSFCLIIMYKIAEKLIDQSRANIIGIIYILHPVAIYTNQSILTEQGAAISFWVGFGIIYYLIENSLSKIKTFGFYCLFWAAAGFSILARLDSLFFMAPLGFYYMYHCRENICWSLWFSSMVLVFLFYGYLESIFSGDFYGPQLNRFYYEGVIRKGNIGAVDNRARIITDLAGNVMYPFLFIAGYYFFKTIRNPTIFHFIIGGFILFHTWLPHKEIRYVYPIAFFCILFMLYHLPKKYFDNFKNPKVLLFWFFVALNWVLLMFYFIPWQGQPRISQQISYMNFKYPKTPIYIASPPKILPNEKNDPFLKILDFERIQVGSNSPPLPFIIFLHDDKHSGWNEFLENNNCKSIYQLDLKAKENIYLDFFKHYFCGNK